MPLVEKPDLGVNVLIIYLSRKLFSFIYEFVNVDELSNIFIHRYFLKYFKF